MIFIYLLLLLLICTLTLSINAAIISQLNNPSINRKWISVYFDNWSTVFYTEMPSVCSLSAVRSFGMFSSTVSTIFVSFLWTEHLIDYQERNHESNIWNNSSWQSWSAVQHTHSPVRAQCCNKLCDPIRKWLDCHYAYKYLYYWLIYQSNWVFTLLIKCQNRVINVRHSFSDSRMFRFVWLKFCSLRLEVDQ